MLKDSLPAGSDPLYRAARAVERDAALNEEMAEWEAATIGDGLSSIAETVADRRKRSG